MPAVPPRRSSSPPPTGSGSRSPGPTVRGWSARRVHLCAQIVAPYPPAGRIGVASQSGNFVSSFMNYSTATGVGDQPRRVGGQRGGDRRRRLPQLLRRRSGHRGRARLRREHRRRAHVPGPNARCRRAQARRARQGRRDRGRRTGSGQPHRRAGGRRRGVRRRLPGGGRDAGGDGGGSVRGGGDVRHPAAACRAERGGADHCGRLGGRDRRRDHRRSRPRAARPPRRSPGIDRRAAAAAMEPQQPGGLRGRRDARHDPCRHGPDRRASGGARRRVPRAGHPVEPGTADARRSLLPRPRAGADRRLPRAPGRPVRRGRRRALARHRQADPDRDRARRCRSGQRRSGHRARHRPALLLVGQPRGDRARPPLPVRRAPAPARPADDGARGASVRARSPASIRSSTSASSPRRSRSCCSRSGGGSMRRRRLRRRRPMRRPKRSPRRRFHCCRRVACR